MILLPFFLYQSSHRIAVYDFKGVNFDIFFLALGTELMYYSEHVPSLAMNYGALRNNKFMYSNMVDVISLRQLLPGLLGLQ